MCACRPSCSRHITTSPHGGYSPQDSCRYTKHTQQHVDYNSTLIGRGAVMGRCRVVCPILFLMLCVCGLQFLGVDVQRYHWEEEARTIKARHIHTAHLAHTYTQIITFITHRARPFTSPRALPLTHTIASNTHHITYPCDADSPPSFFLLLSLSNGPTEAGLQWAVEWRSLAGGA